MRVAWIVAVLFACSKPPTTKQPPAERAADRVVDIAGRWVASDDMDWGYSMTIEPSGVIEVWIDRGKAGRCEEKGTLEPAGSRTFKLTYTRGECNPQAVNVPMDLKIGSFTGNTLTIVVANETRTYERAPDAEPAVERQSPAQLP
ncbi:MAG TPA: hypothetical protein VIV11_21260 [Kofleriaceae bacterium]